MPDFTLPELGENIAAGDVLRVLVKPGDTLAKDQPVLELETDKATIEVPSSVAGTVSEVKVKPGDKVKVGQAILTVDGGGEEAKQGGKAEGGKAEGKAEGGKDEGKVEGRKAEPAAGANTAAKVPGDGALRQTQGVPSERRESGESKDGMEPPVEGTKRDAAGDKAGTKRAAVDEEPTAILEAQDEAPPRDRKVVDISRGARPAAAAEAGTPELPPAPAAPSVRRMARELGVDINQVTGTSDGGRISIEDVKAHAKRRLTEPRHVAAAEPLPDFTRWGDVERQPLRAIRRKTAEHLAAAWATVPHVTQFDLADITGLEELRKKYAKQAEAAGGNLTVTAIAVKVVASALRVFPQFNASLDLAADEIILKKYVHIGIAVDTDRGLLVPVIRNADQKNIVQLAVELAQLSEKARARKLSLDEMQGGCFSISNLGGIGGTAFTPIVNAPEVAILGISRARIEPVHRDGQFVPRLMLPLSLSYDHRAVDGADGIRFLRWVAEALEQPFLLALQG